MNLIEFIDQVLIDEIGEIQNDHKYLSFGLISQGIEFLGSLTDKEELNMNRPGQSKIRFNSALINFFSNRDYHQFANDGNPFNLYSNLRCGLLHVIMPKKNLLLGEIKYDNAKYEHLKLYSDGGTQKLFLMAEALYNDFKEACDLVKSKVIDQSIFKAFPDLSNASQEKIEVISLRRNLLTIKT